MYPSFGFRAPLGRQQLCQLLPLLARTAGPSHRQRPGPKPLGAVLGWSEGPGSGLPFGPLAGLERMDLGARKWR